jgi:membrane-bound ClpP family serine protease
VTAGDESGEKAAALARNVRTWRWATALALTGTILFVSGTVLSFVQDWSQHEQSWSWKLPVAVVFTVLTITLSRFPSLVQRTYDRRHRWAPPESGRLGDGSGPPATST